MNKFIKYFSYLITHKWFVYIECCKHGLIWQGIIHDWSKFLPSEFFPYADYFFGKKTTATIEKFQIAWLHHQNRNPHHWQYWTSPQKDGTTKTVDIPLKYRIEMVCDWLGAGKAKGLTQPNECMYWYMKNKDDIILSENTRIWVEKHLRLWQFIEKYMHKPEKENDNEISSNI